MRAYSFTKREIVLDVFVKFGKFYGISYLQKTAERLLPISSNILYKSFVLLAMNQLSNSWLSAEDLQELFASISQGLSQKYLK